MNVFTSRRLNAPNNRLLYVVLLVSALLLAIVIYFWWTTVYTTPEKVFRGMLERNFSTTGYTREISIKDNNLTQKQYSQIQSGADHIAFSRIDSRSDSGDVQVAEVISTPQEDFVRYIELAYRNAEGELQDTSDAVGVWARQDSGGNLSQSYAQLTLFRTYFPIGNVDTRERANLLRLIEQDTVYEVNFADAKRQNVNGHDVYTYQVTVQLQPYTDMIKSFGRATGQGAIVEGLDPAQSAGTEPVPLEVSVSVASRQLVQVKYSGSEISETYDGFGIQPEVTIPQEFITTQELQQRVSPA